MGENFKIMVLCDDINNKFKNERLGEQKNNRTRIEEKYILEVDEKPNRTLGHSS